MNPNRSPAQPERVGRYEVLVPIASGGMATVYLARSTGFGGFEREVAVKLTHAHLRENRDFATDIIEEGKLAARIRHPHVVSVFDVGEDPLGVFLVMDYIEGDTLAALLTEASRRGAPLPWRVGLRILLDALAGLQAAHDLTDAHDRPAGLVHRDFSPQNILVGLDGMGRLTDFGIAKAASRLSHTATGVVKGKLGYMSPEQIRGRPLDQRSDVWAAGVIAWEMLAGRRLFSGDDASVVFRIATETPPRVDSVVPDAQDAAAAIAHALTHDPRNRCPGAAEFARALLASLQDPSLLADRGEVAEAVQDLVLPKIEARREAVRLIGLRSVQAVAGQTHADLTGPLAVETAAHPAESPRPPVSPAASTPTVVDRRLPDPAPPSRFRASHIALAAGLLVTVTAGLAIALRTPAQQGSPPMSSERPHVNQALSNPIPALEVPTPRQELPTSPTQFISIASDVPLKTLLVEGIPVPMDSPSQTFGIQVSGAEVEKGIAIEAVTIDGRAARVIGDQGQATFKLTFAKQPGVHDAATGARLPFAPNPYATGKP